MKMTGILQLVVVAVIVLSVITLWPVLRGWMALRLNAKNSHRLVEEAERYRIDKLGEIAELRSSDKIRMKSRDAVISRVVDVNAKEEARRASVKKKLIQELGELKKEIGASERAIAQSMAQIELLGELQDSIRIDTEAVQVLGNRIQKLEEMFRASSVESGKLELKTHDLIDVKNDLTNAVASAEATLGRIIAASKEDAAAERALAERNREIRERERVRRELLSEGVQVFEKITNGTFLEIYSVKGQNAGSPRAEFAKVYPDGRVLQLNEGLLKWERFGEVDPEMKSSLDALFSRFTRPFIVRGKFDRKPAEVYLPSKFGLKYLDD